MMKWLRRSAETPKKKSLEDEGFIEDDTELQTIEVRRSETAEIDAIQGFIESPIIESLVMTEADVHMVMRRPAEPTNFCAPTLSLFVQFLASDPDKSRQIDLRKITPERTNELINKIKGIYNNWIVVKHTYSVTVGMLGRKRKKCISMRVQSNEKTALFWVSYISGITSKPLRNVPVLLCQRSRDSNMFDVQVVLENLPICEGRRVTAQFSNEVSTDLRGATEMRVMYEPAREQLTSQGFVRDGMAESPRSREITKIPLQESESDEDNDLIF